MSPLPMMGEVEVVVRSARSTSIHGDLYHDLVVDPSDGSPAEAIRVPAHLCAAAPRPGDRLRLRMLMSQVDAATPI